MRDDISVSLSRPAGAWRPGGRGVSCSLRSLISVAHSRYPCDRREEAIGGESLVMEWNPADVDLRVLSSENLGRECYGPMQ